MTDLIWINTRVCLGDLTPWERNPKQITKAHAERLLAYWRKIGQFQTVAIGPGGEVYDGHQRLSVLLAAEGPDYEIDARQSSRALTEDERAELVIAAHAGTTGQWDWDALSGWDAEALIGFGMDDALLADLNNDAANLALLLEAAAGDGGGAAEDPGAQIDRAEELREEWQTERGQVWEVPSVSVPGRCHRVMCGDSTDAGDVARLMGGEKAGMCFMDPPYATFASSSGKLDITDYEMIKPFFGLIVGLVSANLGRGRAAFICCDWRSYPPLFEKVAHFMSPKNLIVWSHGAKRLGSHFRPTYELLVYALNSRFGQAFIRDKSGDWKIEDRGAPDLWQIPQLEASPGTNREHFSQKPVGLPVYALKHCSNAGEVVLDLFLGSGTTLVACEQTGRIGYGMEIEPKYVAVTLQRLADMGLAPALAAPAQHAAAE
jgi:DNA modification methylase